MNLTPISRKYHGGLHLSFIHWCNLFTKLLHKLVNYKYGNKVCRKVCHKVCRKIITGNIGLSLPGLSPIFHNIQYHLCTTPTHNLFRFITILMLHIKYYIVLVSLHAFYQNAKINENVGILYQINSQANKKICNHETVVKYIFRVIRLNILLPTFRYCHRPLMRWNLLTIQQLFHVSKGGKLILFWQLTGISIFKGLQI